MRLSPLTSLGLVAVLAVLASQAGAAERHTCFEQPPGFTSLPLRAPKARVNEADAQLIRQRLFALYSQDIAAVGGHLDVVETSGMFPGAYASREQKSFVVEITKGMRFHHLMTKDAYTLILCHEIGHHLGGFPKYRESWGSVEGQADYYATLKCARRYYESLPASELNEFAAPLFLVDKCQRQFTSVPEVQICARSLSAGLRVAEIDADLSEVPQSPPRLESEDSARVWSTVEDHPLSQCRLDTYRSGALCSVPWRENLSDAYEEPGACSGARLAQFARPRCWYSPIRELQLSFNP